MLSELITATTTTTTLSLGSACIYGGIALVLGLIIALTYMNTGKVAKLNRVKTTNMGSMYELTYKVELKDETVEKEFLDEIRCRNGNLTVICGRTDYNQLEEL